MKLLGFLWLGLWRRQGRAKKSCWFVRSCVIVESVLSQPKFACLKLGGCKHSFLLSQNVLILLTSSNYLFISNTYWILLDFLLSLHSKLFLIKSCSYCSAGPKVIEYFVNASFMQYNIRPFFFTVM